jgi:citrate lyase subunit beta/citryl-CoA lyase
MPGSNARALQKARDIPADVLILDLEDAVAPDQKESAREQVTAVVAARAYGEREVVIRVNAPGTPWFDADVAAAVQARPDAVLIPKVSSPDTLQRVGARLTSLKAPASTRVWAMIETPLAVLNAETIARCAQDPAIRLDCFILGTNDLAKETRARFVPGREPMRPWLVTCILAARAYGIDILDGVFNALGDEIAYAAECEQGRDLGFDGKTLIHPDQVPTANRFFAPSDEDIRQARAILDAFALPENAGKGAIRLNGRMVELLHADMARRTVGLAEAIARRTG